MYTTKYEKFAAAENNAATVEKDSEQIDRLSKPRTKKTIAKATNAFAIPYPRARLKYAAIGKGAFRIIIAGQDARYRRVSQ